MRVFVTGGSGVLGRALIPLLQSAGHEVIAPRHGELDLYSEAAARSALTGVEAAYHLATRIPRPERVSDPEAWQENDRLRAEATRVLVEAALSTGVSRFILPSVTFLYPAEWRADEETPVVEASERLKSMLVAEEEVRRFGKAGGNAVILRLGLLWGPGTGNDEPQERYGATLHIEDAGSALRAGLEVPGGVYNVVGDAQRIANGRFKTATGWQPQH